MWLYVLLAAIGLVLLAAVVVFNRLIKQRNRVDNAWAQVDVQLRRRYDLIPNLVETVKGYAAHERRTFEDVVAARNAAQGATGVADQAQAEGVLGTMLQRLFALAEQYPDLRASENFQRLQGELSAAEDKIAVARQIYNDTVLTYNTTTQQIPTNVVAALAGFRPREFFEAADDARGAPEVRF
ncbi:MAG: LemA family protein [Actinobacteria bacterium]|nr:LemA family protein [Actinomycetota bacterium]